LIVGEARGRAQAGLFPADYQAAELKLPLLPFMKTASPSLVSESSLTGKYLTVGLANEAYGIAVLKVREIIRMLKITPVPQLPPYVKGVINLRGRVIPVVDLRVKFGLPAEFTERTCVVVVQVRPPSGQPVQMGLIVDCVEEVIHLSSEEIEPTPEFGCKIDTSYLLGLAKVKGQVKTLLDIDRVVAPDAIQQITQAAG
jgi:purine-binding chemotaxis protein CheW